MNNIDSSLFSLDRLQFEDLLSRHFIPKKARAHAQDIFHALYKQDLIANKACLENLGLGLQAFISGQFSTSLPVRVVSTQISSFDGSVKFLMGLEDNYTIETVLILERNRLTLCVSTQVGCAQGCRFCNTGSMGLGRSLKVSEIVGQLLAVNLWRKENSYEALKSYGPITNIVYMGMGEPLDNLDNVISSAKIFTDEKGLFLSHNKVTVSTVGMLPALERLLLETKVCVALSVHSPFDEERSQLMPVNKKHPVTKTLAFLNQMLAQGVRKTFMLQYTLIRGKNDSEAHAEALAQLLVSRQVKINLIPLNEHKMTAYRRPSLERVYAFQKILKDKGFVATLRLSKGRDIAAACGQLVDEAKNQ